MSNPDVGEPNICENHEESFYDAIFKIGNSQILTLTNLNIKQEYQQLINNISLDLQNFILKLKELCPIANKSFFSISNLGSVLIYSLGQCTKIEKNKEIFIFQRIMNLITSSFIVVSGLLSEPYDKNVKYGILYYYFNYVSCILFAFINFVPNIKELLNSNKLTNMEKNFLLIHDYIYCVNLNLLEYGYKQPFEIHEQLFLLSQIVFDSLLYISVDPSKFKDMAFKLMNKIKISIKNYTKENQMKMIIPNLI